MGLVVDDLEAVTAFLLDLGLEREGAPEIVEGDWVGTIIGLEGVRAEIVFVRAPDGSGRLELVKFHSPAHGDGPHASPANQLGLRHIALVVDDLDAIVSRLRDNGSELVGEVQDYEDIFRLCYVRGPEGLIIELAQRIG